MAISYYTFTDQLPPGLVFESGPYPNLGTPNQPIFQIPIDDLAADGSIAFSFTVTTTSDAPTNTLLVNNATLTDGATTLTAADDGITLTSLSANLAATKTGVLTMPADGNNGTIQWTVNVANTGPGTASSIQISDTLQQGQVFTGQVTSPQGAVTTNGTPQSPSFILDAPLPPGQTASLTFQTTVPRIPNADLNIDPGTLITDIAIVNADLNIIPNTRTTAIASVNGIPTNRASVTLPAPTFTTQKIASTFNPEPGDVFYYTITATNTGTLAAMPFIVTDPLPTMADASGLSTPLMTYDGGDVTATLSNFTDPISVTAAGTAQIPIFAVNQIVRPGQTVAITFPVTLSSDAPLNVPIPNSRAYVQGFRQGPRTRVQEAQPISPDIPSFSNPRKTSVPSNVTTPGSIVAFSVSATNASAMPTDLLTITNTFPDYMTYAGNLSLEIGDDTVPSSAYTVSDEDNTLTVTVTDPDYQVPVDTTTQLNFDAQVSSDVPLGTYIQNSALFQTGPDDDAGATANSHLPYVGIPQFSNVSKAASRQVVAPGDIFTYSITALQSGDAPTAPFTISDALPEGLTYVRSSVTAILDGNAVNVQIGGDGKTPVFTITDPIRSQSSIILSFTVQTSPDLPIGTTLINNATLKGYSDDPGTVTSASVQIGTPAFTEVTKTADTASIYPGDSFTYTIQARNNTSTTLEPFIVTDALPQGLTATGQISLTFNGQTIPATLTQSGQTITITSSQPLPPQSSATLSYQVKSNPSLTDQTPLINVAHLIDADGNDHAVSALPVTVTAPIFPGISKNTSQVSAAIGDTFTYTILGTNAGGAPTIRPLLINDILPPGLTYAGNPTATLNGHSVPVTVTGTNSLTFSLDTVVSTNDAFSLSFQVTVNDQATSGLSIINTATIISYPNDLGYPVEGLPVAIGHPDFSGSTKIASDANGNSIENAPISYHGSIIYTITATNRGTGQAIGPLRVTDTLPAGVTYDPTYPVIATFDVPDSGTFEAPLDVDVADTGTNESLIFEYPVTQTYLPVGTTVTFSYKVNLSPDAPNPIRNTALVHADDMDLGVPTTESVVNTGRADFSQGATKVSDPETPIAGHPFTYTITATNTGTTPSPNFIITDPLPSPLSYNPHGGAAATLDGQSVPVAIGGTATVPTFTVSTQVPIGSTVTITFLVVSPYNAPPTIQNTASLQSTLHAPADTVTATTTLLPPPPSTDTLTKTSSSSSVFPGQTLDYTLNWQHLGDVSYDSVALTDLLPSYVSFPVGATAHILLSTGEALDVSNTGTVAVPIFQIPGPLAPGTTATISFSPILSSEAQTGITLINNAFMANGSDISYATDSGISIESPNIDITKTASTDAAYPSDLVLYTITATNNSKLPLADFSLIDTLPEGLTVQRLRNIQGQIDNAAVNVDIGGTPTVPVFSTEAPLPVGSNFTLTFEAPVPASAEGNTKLYNTATLSAFTGDFGTSATDAGVLVLPAVLDNELFAKTSIPSTVRPGEAITYTFTFHSQEAINTDLTLTDFLPLAPDGYAAVTVPDGATAHVTVNNNSYDIPNTGTDLIPVFSLPAPIPQNSNVTLAFTAIFNPENAQSGDFVNHAILKDGGKTYLRADDSPGFFAGALFVPTKTATPTTAEPGDSITYTITAKNIGTMAADPFTVEEALPLGIRYTPRDTVSATLDGQAVDVNTTFPTGPRHPTFTLDAPVPAGATVILTFTAHVNSTAVDTALLVNSATISAFSGDLGTTCWDDGVLISNPPAPPAPTPPILPPTIDRLSGKYNCKRKVFPCKALPLQVTSRMGVGIRQGKDFSLLLQPNTTYEMSYQVTLLRPTFAQPTIGLSLGGEPLVGSRITSRARNCTTLTMNMSCRFTTGPNPERLQLLNYSSCPLFVLCTTFTLNKL